MTNPPHPAFQIVERIGSNQIVGRNCGSDISLKTVFTTLIEQRFSGPITDIVKNERTLSADISISILSIEAFSQSLQDLNSGMTAKLTISGRGLDLLEVPFSERYYLSLEAPARNEFTS